MNFQSNSTGNLFYTGSADCTIKCWDGFMGSVICSLTGHTGEIKTIVTMKDVAYIASGGSDRDIRIWDLQGSASSRADESVSASKLSGSVNQTIAKLHGSLGCVHSLCSHPRIPHILCSGGADQCIRLWDIRTNRCVLNFFGHKGTVETICMQGMEPQILSGSSDGAVHAWNITAGKEDPSGKTPPKALKYHSKSVRASFLHPKEYLYMSLSSDSYQYWNLPSLNAWKRIHPHQVSTLRSFHGDSLNAACLSESGRFFVTGHASGTLRFLDWQSGMCYLEKHERSTSETQLRLENGGVQGSSFSEQQRGIVATVLNKGDNMLFTSLRDKTIHLYINTDE
uniref:Guanine nucleotide-binding protein subunit beta-like protein n=1 Tax=Paramoeba aestuarina TaxID=180227 RepID=A0A7S4KYH6_9EUKA